MLEAAKLVATMRERVDAETKGEAEARKTVQTFKERGQEEERVARERAQTEDELQKKLITLRNESFEAERQLLAQEVAAYREAGVAETTVAAIEAEKRQDILRREVEAALKALETEQTGRDAFNEQTLANRQKIETILIDLEAKGSKTRLDDFEVFLAKQYAALVASYATREDLRAFCRGGERRTSATADGGTGAGTPETTARV